MQIGCLKFSGAYMQSHLFMMYQVCLDRSSHSRTDQVAAERHIDSRTHDLLACEQAQAKLLPTCITGCCCCLIVLKRHRGSQVEQRVLEAGCKAILQSKKEHTDKSCMHQQKPSRCSMEPRVE